MTDLNLDRMEELEQAATEGPWDSYRPNPAYRIYELCSTTPQGLNETLAEVSGYNASADAEFIAAARTSVPRMIAALEAVTALYDALPKWAEPDNLPADEHDVGYHDGLAAAIRAIEAALGGEGDAETG